MISIRANPTRTNFSMEAIMDSDSQLIIAVHVRPDGEPPREIIKMASERTIRPPRKIITNLDQNTIQHLLQSGMRQTQTVQHETTAGASRNNRMNELVRILEKRSNSQGSPRREFMQEIMEGIQQDLNFYRSISPQVLKTPAEQLGLKPRYAGWDQVGLELMMQNSRRKNEQEYRQHRSTMGLMGSSALAEAGENGAGENGEKENPVEAPREFNKLREAGIFPKDGVISHPVNEHPGSQHGSQTGNGRTDGSSNEGLLRELYAFLEDIEPQRERVRAALKIKEDATEAAWKLFTSLDAGTAAEAAQPASAAARGPERTAGRTNEE